MYDPKHMKNFCVCVTTHKLVKMGKKTSNIVSREFMSDFFLFFYCPYFKNKVCYF